MLRRSVPDDPSADLRAAIEAADRANAVARVALIVAAIALAVAILGLGLPIDVHG